MQLVEEAIERRNRNKKSQYINLSVVKCCELAFYLLLSRLIFYPESTLSKEKKTSNHRHNVDIIIQSLTRIK